jgi:hypothetical protein
MSFTVLLTYGLLSVIKVSSPDTAHAAALEDLINTVAKPDQEYTRYLALWTMQPAEREEFARSFNYWANSLHWRKTIVHVPMVSNNQFLRVNLRELGWDRYERARLLANFEKLGAKYTFKDDYERSTFLNIWERIARKDPYFKVTMAAKDGKIYRGWINPENEVSARTLSQSMAFCLRADWFMKQVAFDRPKGFYSDVLMLPETEQELYKMLGVDENFVTVAQSLQGDFVLKSDVALHGRGLEFLPSLTGRGVQFLWRTLDTTDNLNKRSAVNNLLGTIQFDGREVIATLPDGMHLYYLVNGQRKQVGEVPTNIAQRKGHPEDVIVYNAWTCVSCHDQGINRFNGVGKTMAVSRNVAIAAIVEGGDYKDARERRIKVEELTRKVEDYYTSIDISSIFDTHQLSYNRSLLAINGLKGDENARSFVSFIEAYTFDYVNFDQAALEMGFEKDIALHVLKNSDDEDLLVVAVGQSIPRDAFEDSISEGMKAFTYPWEKKVE